LVRAAIENASRDGFADVLVAVRSCGALDAARRHGVEETARAKAALAPLPESKFRETLLQLADFAVQRSF
jgi:octaprenyl-diphosphate synthase